MEIVAAISALLGSSTVGTLIGGLFAFMHKKQDASIEIAKTRIELEMRDKDIELAKVEAQSAQQVRVEEADIARFNSIGAVQQLDNIEPDIVEKAGKFKILYVIADVLRRLIRPVSTIALLGSALWISWYLLVSMDSWNLLGTEEKYQLAMQAMTWVFGQASAVISFWFVSRGVSK